MELATLLNQLARWQRSTWSESCHGREFPPSQLRRPREDVAQRGPGISPPCRQPVLWKRVFQNAPHRQPVGRDTPHSQWAGILLMRGVQRSDTVGYTAGNSPLFRVKLPTSV